MLDSYVHLEILTRNADSYLSEKNLSVHEALHYWSTKQSHAAWENDNPIATSMCCTDEILIAHLKMIWKV